MRESAPRHFRGDAPARNAVTNYYTHLSSRLRLHSASSEDMARASSEMSAAAHVHDRRSNTENIREDIAAIEMHSPNASTPRKAHRALSHPQQTIYDLCLERLSAQKLLDPTLSPNVQFDLITLLF